MRLLRGVEHIERNLGEALSLREVATRAAFSEFHFHRQFRLRFGAPVMDYIRRRRLAAAAHALLHTRRTVLDIALEAGFESQAAFTRAFRKVYHTTPAAWRARGRDVPWLSSAPISDDALSMFPGLGESQPRRAVLPGFDVAGLAVTIDAAQRAQTSPALWARFAASTGGERLARAELLGLSGGNDTILDGKLELMVAMRIDATADAPVGLERRTIPGGAYLVFDFTGEWSRIPDAFDFIFGNWMPASRHRLRQAANLSRHQAPSSESGGSIEIWIPVE